MSNGIHPDGEPRTGALLVRLKRLICIAYSEAEFGELMLETVDSSDFDFFGLSPKTPYPGKVLEVVLWLNRDGGLESVRDFARTVSYRRLKRPELREFVQEVEAMVGGEDGKGPEPTFLPPEIAASLDVFEGGASTLPVLVRDLRSLLRSGTFDAKAIAEQFHLSELDSRRLAAVLALERYPHPLYLRWLSERVTVEQPLVAFISSQALTAAALRLQRQPEVLARVRAAVEDAADRLDALTEDDDEAVPGHDVSSRKRQLVAAMSLVEARSRKGGSLLPTPDLDAFLTALVETFDLNTLEGLCQKHLQTSLKRLANPDDPMELIIVSVWLMARDRGWERELITAAFQERQDQPVLAEIHQRFGAV